MKNSLTRGLPLLALLFGAACQKTADDKAAGEQQNALQTQVTAAFDQWKTSFRQSPYQPQGFKILPSMSAASAKDLFLGTGAFYLEPGANGELSRLSALKEKFQAGQVAKTVDSLLNLGASVAEFSWSAPRGTIRTYALVNNGAVKFDQVFSNWTRVTSTPETVVDKAIKGSLANLRGEYVLPPLEPYEKMSMITPQKITFYEGGTPKTFSDAWGVKATFSLEHNIFVAKFIYTDTTTNTVTRTFWKVYAATQNPTKTVTSGLGDAQSTLISSLSDHDAVTGILHGYSTISYMWWYAPTGWPPYTSSFDGLDYHVTGGTSMNEKAIGRNTRYGDNSF